MLPWIPPKFFGVSTINTVLVLRICRAIRWIAECAMTEELTRLIEAAKQRPFPEEEREAQRRSFAYGNAKIENDRVTWEMIVEADEKIKAEITATK